MVSLHATQHDSVSDQSQFVKADLSSKLGIAGSDWVQDLLIEDRDMVESAVIAVCAHLILIL